jgi:hypothetical protein
LSAADTTQQQAAIALADLQFQREQEHRRVEALVARQIDLGDYTVSILKTTLSHAAGTYRRITLMNAIMFVLGIALFAVAAAYGVLSNDNKGYTFLFAGMGAGSFAVLFLTGPIEKTQIALSNLVQVEVAFMNYFEQITIWDGYAAQPTGDPPMPSPENMEYASESLQTRTSETLELLQKYLERPLKTDDATPEPPPTPEPAPAA